MFSTRQTLNHWHSYQQCIMVPSPRLTHLYHHWLLLVFILYPTLLEWGDISLECEGTSHISLICMSLVISYAGTFPCIFWLTASLLWGCFSSYSHVLMELVLLRFEKWLWLRLVMNAGSLGVSSWVGDSRSKKMVQWYRSASEAWKAHCGKGSLVSHFLPLVCWYWHVFLLILTYWKLPTVLVLSGSQDPFSCPIVSSCFPWSHIPDVRVINFSSK